MNEQNNQEKEKKDQSNNKKGWTPIQPVENEWEKISSVKEDKWKKIPPAKRE
jgi:hypothetical protein